MRESNPLSSPDQTSRPTYLEMFPLLLLLLLLASFAVSVGVVAIVLVGIIIIIIVFVAVDAWPVFVLLCCQCCHFSLSLCLSLSPDWC